ncbi:MAG: J domain-containing protein [Methylobacter sp.]
MKTDEVKSLFNKYSDDDYDTISQETDAAVGALMKNIAQNMFNVDLDDDIDVSSPEKLHAHLQEKLRELAENQAQTQTAEAVKQPKKSKKQLEKEARQEEEEALASKSVQEVYRKLVAALHPDREPDAQERERKTELMQRVNIAYGKKDLLQLLELQLEIEQIDAAHLSQMADSRLKYFNKILREQLAELDQEIYHIQESVKLQLNLPFYTQLSPKQLLLHLANDIRQLQADLVDIQRELEDFQNPAALKAWLKTYKIPKKNDRDIFDDDFFGGMMPFDFR